jgi:hypothetical protein
MSFGKLFTIEGFDEYNVDKQDMQVWGQECNDGYHTFSELYNHRHALFIALCKIYDNYLTPFNTRVKCWKSKLHHDGTMFHEFFILGMSVIQFTGKVEYITYHLPIALWDRINVIELDRAPEWDGHTSEDVIKRLYSL